MQHTTIATQPAPSGLATAKSNPSELAPNRPGPYITTASKSTPSQPAALATAANATPSEPATS